MGSSSWTKKPDVKNVFRGVWVNNAKRKTWAVWSVCYTFQLPAARFSYFCTEMHREGTERGFKGAKLYHFLIDKNKWLLTNTKSMFVSVIHDGVLGPPRLDCHDWWCPCLEATFKAILMALEGRPVSSKKPFIGPKPRQESCWEEEENKVTPLQANQIFFT